MRGAVSGICKVMSSESRVSRMSSVGCVCVCVCVCVCRREMAASVCGVLAWCSRAGTVLQAVGWPAFSTVGAVGPAYSTVL